MPKPKFIPKPGQVDYTNIRYAPVVNVVVTNNGKILLVQRSASLRLYPNYWNGISGFLDDQRDIEEKVHEELREELGLSFENITSLERGKILLQEAPNYSKTWLVVPLLARVNRTDFKLDWEAQAAKWYVPTEIKKLDLMPGFKEVIEQFLEVI